MEASQYLVDILEKRMSKYRDMYLTIMCWITKSYYLCVKNDPNYQALFTKDFGFQDQVHYYQEGLNKILCQ